MPGYKSFTLEDNTAKIFSLFKNSDGYILVGSSTGLYKFDGSRFRKIETDKPGTSDTVTAIFQDNAKALWIGYQSGRIAKTTAGKLQYIEPEEGLPKKRITAFLQDRNNNIWFSTRGEGIYYFTNKRLHLINEENGLTDLNIYAMAMAGNGDVIAATDQGLAVCSGNGLKKSVSMIDPSKGLPDYIVTSIVPDGNGNFWIGLQDKGFCLYNHSTKKITVPSTVAGWNKGQVNAVYYTHGNVWITTQDSGLINYLPATDQLIPVQVLSAQQKNAGNLIEDNQGNMWLIVDNNILVRASCNALKLHQLYSDEFFVTVHTILVDDEKNYWTGTDMAVVKYTYKDGRYISKKYPVAGLDIKTDVTSLYQDQFRNIWIGTMGNGIYILNPITGQTRQLKEAVRSGSILSITGNGKTVCAAGLEGALVFELTPANNTINHEYTFTSYNNIQTIGSTYIYNVFKDSKQRVWFATDGKGLTMLSNGVFTHYNEKNGIRDEHIYSVTEDQKGTIWFSTSSAGVYSFDGKTFTNYGLNEGLSSLSVSAIKADKLGNIIVIHKEGIDIINGTTGGLSYINTSQGISGINDGLGAVCTDNDGNIFVGTKKGILQYNPLEGISTIPHTIIESVQLFLNEIDTVAMHRFKYNENNISFDFTGIYFTSPDKVFYQYKLEGLDSPWQFTADNSKSFPRLLPGKYVFRVRSSLNKNFNSVSEAAYAFEIAKPFWKTWWFIVGCSIVFIGLLYWYIKRREAHLTHMERLQGEKIKFEFEVLRNQVNPHFLFNSFNTLISTIEDNPKNAVEYVEQLSDFFRNIVNYRDRDTISLTEEISLLQNYLYLQQKRYGNHLQLDIHIAGQDQECIFLPPLTLQLLTENAIKHNVVSKEAALLIQIDTQDGYVIVQNNVNKKINKEKGTGMGLQNIVSRYALLSDKPVLIKPTHENFMVSLPILKHN
ncbi:MAG: histidine kinase [Chitinophagaceae bacterium]|nr:histidine kinase [Chitinophagaceae bacterium]